MEGSGSSYQADNYPQVFSPGDETHRDTSTRSSWRLSQDAGQRRRLSNLAFSRVTTHPFSFYSVGLHGPTAVVLALGPAKRLLRHLLVGRP